MKKFKWLLISLFISASVSSAQSSEIKQESSRDEAYKLEMLSSAVKLYKSHNQRYPRRLDHLIFDTGFSSWKGPYIKASWLYDSNSKMVRYRFIRRKMDLRFPGADGVFYTKDDIYKKIRLPKRSR